MKTPTNQTMRYRLTIYRQIGLPFTLDSDDFFELCKRAVSYDGSYRYQIINLQTRQLMQANYCHEKNARMENAG